MANTGLMAGVFRSSVWLRPDADQNRTDNLARTLRGQTHKGRARGLSMYVRSFVGFVVLMTACLVSSASFADNFERNIMTGGPSGTYIQFGRDIAALGKSCGLNLNVVESAGSLENFSALRNRRNTQFGIVQSDVLEYLKTYESADPEIQQAVRGVRIMLPLYNEEIHILARKDIADVSSLSGRRVAIGKVNSGTYLTASLMLDILGIKGAQRLEFSQDEALPMLERGEIDAFFYVAGAPASLFVKNTIDGSRFHLLPIRDEALMRTYTPTTIAAGTYSFQEQPVDLIAVKAVLMTFEYEPGRNAYHRESCHSVQNFSRLIVDGLERLQGEGHPKWKQVNLSALPPGWQVGTCVREGLDPSFEPTCAPTSAGGGNEQYLDLLKQHLKP